MPRYLIVGSAGSLEIAPGKRVFEQPDFPEAYKQEARAGAEFLGLLRAEPTLNWTFLSPSADFVPGERTGAFRLGKDTLLSNDQGSSISFEEYAFALVDEIERPAHINNASLSATDAELQHRDDMTKLTHIFAIAAVLMAPSMIASPALAQAATTNQAAPRDLVTEEANRKLVVNFYDQFFNAHETAQAAQVIADDYIQHNPDVPDGKAPFLEFFTGFFKENPQSRARIVRSATDGDLVYLHIHSTNGPDDRGQAVVDIFRVSGGKIVEHWDVIQNVPEPTANTNTMF